MTQYQYRIERLPGNNNLASEMLNDMGRYGWQLVGPTPHSSSEYIFMRERPGKLSIDGITYYLQEQHISYRREQ